MSVYAAQAASTTGSGALDPYGLYDSAGQIVVIPSAGIPAFAVVEHELTHVNLVNNTSFGLLERVVRCAMMVAAHLKDADALQHLRSLANDLGELGNLVHETVAWFGSELITQGHENLAAPGTYATTVKRLRTTLAAKGLLPASTDTASFVQVMSVAEELAMYALDSPFTREVWQRVDRLTLSDIARGFYVPDNNPRTRFERILKRVEGLERQQLLDWVERHSAQGDDDDDQAHATARQLPAPKRTLMFRSKTITSANPDAFLTEESVGVIRRLLQLAGVEAAHGPTITDERLADQWFYYRVLKVFQPTVDRYAQVCVLEPRKAHRGATVTQASPPAELLLADALTVSLTEHDYLENIDWEIKQLAPWVLGTLGPERGIGWMPDPEQLHAFLHKYSRERPVLVSSIGYNYGSADFNIGDVLREVPHVVVAPSDFRGVWLRIAHFDSPNGLAGSKRLEHRPMPSPTLGSEYGYILLKPADRPYPIVVVPAVISKYERIMSVVEQFPSPHGVVSVEAGGNPYAWLGPIGPVVEAAAYVFENRSYRARPYRLDF